MEPGHWPQWRPLKRHDSHIAEQMVERAAELARDSHARTRHAAVLMRDDSMLGWGTNGVPFPGEDHCYCKFAEAGHHDMCRTHAEQRAITLAREGDGWRMLPGSKLIYVRLESDDSVRLEKPHFCPRCSRLALSLGVAGWIFALSEGLVGYSSVDYDTISQLGWLPRTGRGMLHELMRGGALELENGVPQVKNSGLRGSVTLRGMRGQSHAHRRPGTRRPRRTARRARAAAG